MEMNRNDTFATGWNTSDGDTVTIGDLVAIRIAHSHDTYARLAGRLEGEEIDCVVTESDVYPVGEHIPVTKDQLLMKIPEKSEGG